MQLVLETLERARRLPKRLRSKALRYGAIAVAVGAACIAAPVLAHDGPKTPPPACSTTLPLTTPCTPTLVRPGEPGAPYLVTLPGVGTRSFLTASTSSPTTSDTRSASGV